MNNQDVLKYALEHGMIDMSYVQEQIQMEKRKELFCQGLIFQNIVLTNKAA